MEKCNCVPPSEKDVILTVSEILRRQLSHHAHCSSEGRGGMGVLLHGDDRPFGLLNEESHILKKWVSLIEIDAKRNQN